MNPVIDRRALAPICASLILLLCTFNLSCSSSPCAPVFHATDRLDSATFHSFESVDRIDGTSYSDEGIRVNGIVYAKNDGKWAVIDSTNDDREGFSDRMKAVTSISCHLEGTELIDGESADYYVTEGILSGYNIHGRFWVSQSTGLPLRVNYKGDSKGLGSGGMSLRYEYANVTAPIISK